MRAWLTAGVNPRVCLDTNRRFSTNNSPHFLSPPDALERDRRQPPGSHVSNAPVPGSDGPIRLLESGRVPTGPRHAPSTVRDARPIHARRLRQRGGWRCLCGYCTGEHAQTTSTSWPIVSAVSMCRRVNVPKIVSHRSTCPRMNVQVQTAVRRQGQASAGQCIRCNVGCFRRPTKRSMPTKIRIIRNLKTCNRQSSRGRTGLANAEPLHPTSASGILQLIAATEPIDPDDGTDVPVAASESESPRLTDRLRLNGIIPMKPGRPHRSAVR